MNPSIKAILSVVAAGITTFVVMIIGEVGLDVLYKLEYVNPANVDQYNAFLASLPWDFYVLTFVIRFFAMTCAGWVGTRISGKITTAVTIGVVFMVFAGMNMYNFPGHPGWAWGSLIVYPIGSYIGYIFASRRADALKS